MTSPSTPSFPVVQRFLAAGALALGLWSVPGLLIAAPPASKSFSAVATAAEPRIHTLRLANGDLIDATITGYSLQSRVLTLQLINGTTTHVSPRDLTAMSKLVWLTSPAFKETLAQYRPSNQAIAIAIERLVPPLLVTLLAGFLCFWGGVALVGAPKRIGRASLSYVKSLFHAVVLFIALVFALYGVERALGNSPVAPLIHGVLFAVAIIATVLILSNQIGGDYDLSTWMGFSIVVTSTGIGALSAVTLLYLLPRFMERPGIDDWFTDRLLVPLGLA